VANPMPQTIPKLQVSGGGSYIYQYVRVPEDNLRFSEGF
jgi:hypothetical protein